MEPSKKKKYILVAEDDKFYANIYKTKFSKEGYEVAVVGDGQKLLDEVRSRQPDLILLDLIMPVMDGFEALEKLKADSKLKNIKVLVSSNLGQAEDIKRARDLGAVDYLTKATMSIQQMVDKVKETL